MVDHAPISILSHLMLIDAAIDDISLIHGPFSLSSSLRYMLHPSWSIGLTRLHIRLLQDNLFHETRNEIK